MLILGRLLAGMLFLEHSLQVSQLVLCPFVLRLSLHALAQRPHRLLQKTPASSRQLDCGSGREPLLRKHLQVAKFSIQCEEFSMGNAFQVARGPNFFVARSHRPSHRRHARLPLVLQSFTRDHAAGDLPDDELWRRTSLAWF